MSEYYQPRRAWGASSASLVAAGLSVLVGVAGAAHPVVFLALCSLALLAVVAAVAFRWPAAAMRVAPWGVLLADTKFRLRHPTETLAGSVDSQVLFELALFGALGVAAAAAIASGGARRLALTSTEWLMAAVVALAAASLFWSRAPTLTGVRATQLSILVSLVVAGARVLGPVAFLRALAAPVIAYTLLFALMALTMPWADGRTQNWYGVVRFAWFAVHPITCATFAGIGAVFLSASALWGRWSAPGGGALWRHALGVALAAALLSVLALTRSRGPAAALVAGVGALAVLRFRPSRSIPLGLALLALVAALVANSPVSPADLLRRGASSDNAAIAFIYRGQSASDLADFSGRAELWRAVGASLRDRPVAGHGYQGARSLLLAEFPWASYAHNAFAEALLDLGVVGALLLAAVLLRALSALPTRGFADASGIGRDRAASFGVAVFLLVNSVTSESFAAAPGFETLLLFACALAAERLRALAVRGGSASGGVVA